MLIILIWSVHAVYIGEISLPYKNVLVLHVHLKNKVIKGAGDIAQVVE